jgi:hypothetical protein
MLAEFGEKESLILLAELGFTNCGGLCGGSL